MLITEPRFARFVMLCALSCASCSGSVPQQKCNGHQELCDRRFDQVAYPMTHNAMANAAAEWFLANQNFGITRQLHDGIRGLMLDVYEEEGDLLLCHVLCGAGSQPLVEGKILIG